MLLLISILLAVFVLPPEWAIPAVLIGAALELCEALLFMRYSRRGRVRVGAETMLGQRARVETACLPDGQVWLAGERWAARCAAGAPVGATVVVRAREDLTLIVEPED